MSKHKSHEETSTDELQNGGQKSLDERVAELEKRLDLVVRCNCLLESERHS